MLLRFSGCTYALLYTFLLSSVLILFLFTSLTFCTGSGIVTLTN
jgi:hypothetical protein